MDMLKYDQDLVAGWEEIVEELRKFGEQPTEDELRDAMFDAVQVFRQGELTEAELRLVVYILASQMIDQKLVEVVGRFGKGLDEEPGFVRRNFKPASILRR